MLTDGEWTYVHTDREEHCYEFQNAMIC